MNWRKYYEFNVYLNEFDLGIHKAVTSLDTKKWGTALEEITNVLENIVGGWMGVRVSGEVIVSTDFTIIRWFMMNEIVWNASQNAKMSGCIYRYGEFQNLYSTSTKISVA